MVSLFCSNQGCPGCLYFNFNFRSNYNYLALRWNTHTLRSKEAQFVCFLSVLDVAFGWNRNETNPVKCCMLYITSFFFKTPWKRKLQDLMGTRWTFRWDICICLKVINIFIVQKVLDQSGWVVLGTHIW